MELQPLGGVQGAPKGEGTRTLAIVRPYEVFGAF